MTDSEDLGALTERTRRALADDPRLGQLDVCITLRGQRALLTGHVVTEDRRRLVAEVVAGHLPGYEIDNATTTIDHLPEPPATAEELGADR
ncbi:MAG TPA: BON domain-containing protein [Acidimicrobiia bacterium]|nr:BON domain-containing protein [Acidimicrobiia bacterium]